MVDMLFKTDWFYHIKLWNFITVIFCFILQYLEVRFNRGLRLFCSAICSFTNVCKSVITFNLYTLSTMQEVCWIIVVEKSCIFNLNLGYGSF